MNEEQKKKNDITDTLPEFTNQLLLMMNSGLILKDAVMRIAELYEKSGDNKNYFKNEIVKLKKKQEKTGENIIRLFYGFSRCSKVKELMRIGSILRDNMDKGTILWEKLYTESNELWNERKRRANEAVKKADTKLSFPLAIMLISLIIITIAPCMIDTV